MSVVRVKGFVDDCLLQLPVLQTVHSGDVVEVCWGEGGLKPSGCRKDGNIYFISLAHTKACQNPMCDYLLCYCIITVFQTYRCRRSRICTSTRRDLLVVGRGRIHRQRSRSLQIRKKTSARLLARSLSITQTRTQQL